MDITLVIPHDEGTPDIGGDISLGLRVFPGKLNIDQILELTQESCYEERAVMLKRNDKHEVTHVSVSFSMTKGERPTVVDRDEPYFRGWEGSYFEEDKHHKGKLTYEVEFSAMASV